VPRHVARLITLLVAPLVIDYFASAARLGALAHRAARLADRRVAHHLSSTTSPTPRGQVPRHVAWLVTPLVVDYSASRMLVVDYSASPRLVVDYSVRHDFVLRPHWLYLHAVRRDYLSRGNTGSISSTPRVATTSSSGRIVSTIHLD
jgi:hypothetical protein